MKKITALAALLAIPAMAAPAGYFQVPGTETTMKIYGMVDVDAWYTLKNTNGGFGDGLDAAHESTVNKNQWHWKVNDSRIGITSTTPSAYGDVVVKLEGDFNGKAKSYKLVSGTTLVGSDDWNGTFRIRHAYGEFAGLLVGQTSSLWGAWHNTPGYIDNDGLLADFYGNGRVLQARYTAKLSDAATLAFSVEKNKNTTNSSGYVGWEDQADDKKFPGNFVGAFQYSADWGSVVASVAYQKINDWSKSGTDVLKHSKSSTSWALSGAFNIGENDSVTASVLNGLGFYGVGVLDAFNADGVNGSGDEEYLTPKALAYTVGYSHTWNDKFTSNAGIGYVKYKKDEDNGIAEKVTVTQFFVNTIWQITKTAKFGAEYWYGTAKVGADYFTKDNGQLTDKIKESRLSFNMNYMFF